MTAPGDALLHPVALVSLVVLVVNDHVLKHRTPGWASGKLSDVAILVVGPLLLQGCAELWAARGGRAWRPSTRVFAVATAVTCVAYALEKTIPAATEVYRLVWGGLRWPLDGGLAAAVRIVGGLEARVGLDVRAYLHSANREAGDRYEATGASDTYVTGTFGLAWRQ